MAKCFDSIWEYLSLTCINHKPLCHFFLIWKYYSKLGFTSVTVLHTSISNNCIEILLSDSNLFIRSEIVFAQAESVLSSAKLWIEEDSMKKKRSLIEKSNRSGPTIEPCGTLVMIFSKLLCVLFIRTHCFQFFK